MNFCRRNAPSNEPAFTARGYIGFEKIFGDRYYDDGEFIGNSVIKTVTDYVDADSYKRLNEFYSNIFIYSNLLKIK